MPSRALPPSLPLLALLGTACTPDDTPPPAEAPLTVLTFNTGTSTGLRHDADDPDDGYSSATAQLVDAHYGNAMAWRPAEEAVTAWLATVQPDVVGFQEIGSDAVCDTLPDTFDPAAHDLLCDPPDPSGRTQPQRVLGEGHQVACHPGKPDKCLGVRTAFATIRGCDDDLCLEGLEGREVPGCGSGARVAAATLDRPDGTALRVVHIHGSSGISVDEAACRVAQLEAVFDGTDDAPPLVGDGTLPVLVLGDLNTDPTRFAATDASARYLLDLVDDTPFAFHTDISEDGPRPYAGLASIDHVLSDHLEGDCTAVGLDPDGPEGDPFGGFTFFDHRPILCRLTAD